MCDPSNITGRNTGLFAESCVCNYTCHNAEHTLGTEATQAVSKSVHLLPLKRLKCGRLKTHTFQEVAPEVFLTLTYQCICCHCSQSFWPSALFIYSNRGPQDLCPEPYKLCRVLQKTGGSGKPSFGITSKLTDYVL